MIILMLIMTFAISSSISYAENSALFKMSMDYSCYSKEQNSEVQMPAKLKIKSEDQENIFRIFSTGLRKKYIFKIYASAFYLPADFNPGNNLQDQFVNGEFPRIMMMHFLRDIGKDRMLDNFRENLITQLGNIDDDRWKHDCEKFFSFFDQDAEKGNNLYVIYLPQKGIIVSSDNTIKGNVNNIFLTKAIFSIWFGDKPISEELKRALLTENYPECK